MESIVEIGTTYPIGGLKLLVMAILVLYLGEFLTHRFPFLLNNNIPAAVTGGLLCSSALALLSHFEIAHLDFELELRNSLLLIFFSTIGLTAKFSALLIGGRAMILLITVCTLFILFQNVVGILIASLIGQETVYGLFVGSISLVGGHGTAIAWGEVATEDGIRGAAELGVAGATLGLIIGGLIGGPVAGRLIRKKQLSYVESDAIGANHSAPANQNNSETEPAASKSNPIKHYVSIRDFLGTVLALGLCLGFGEAVNHYLFSYEIRLPGFLTAMMVGVVITNITSPLKKDVDPDAINLIGGVSLHLFLAMSLMSMDLLSLVNSAGLLLTTMVAQTILIIFFATHIVFKMMGSDYDAAVITGGFIGMGLGATPVAIANMTAISREHGPSMKALLVVPLVGAFFIDLVNAVVIELFLRLPFMS
ncbi:sodium/glutamate symporter [Aestuariirhabdus sp. Z084]|uniref:sodium/glutamate symporter n=1 Tax=Aestuariirhabdus haliotis TaxID=2918751 RepID=UPI00201B3835|nr:sodium/glutamate symporter [Aestuariirhabdus haliotis]MCL6416835.1 sodium/glutamate symporter [Aestuariirhabdus haliotis]MCL6420835.1 sodium/glutamate symporter [Aestuariirhabdus haliotis]